MRVDAYDSHMCVCLSLLERAQKSRKKEKDPAKLTQQFNVRDKQTQTKRPLLRFVLNFLNIQSRLADISIVFKSWNLYNFKTYIHLQRTNIKTSFQNFGATSRCGVLSLAFLVQWKREKRAYRECISDSSLLFSCQLSWYRTNTPTLKSIAKRERKTQSLTLLRYETFSGRYSYYGIVSRLFRESCLIKFY